MKTLLAVAACAVLALLPVSSRAQAPQGPPPTLKVVSGVDKEKGNVTFLETICRQVPVQKQIVVVVNGQQKTETVTDTVSVMEQRFVLQDLATSRVLTQAGKQLPIEEVWKRLKKNDVVAVSGSQDVPAQAFLRALSADTLIIVPGPTAAQKVPVPAPKKP